MHANAPPKEKRAVGSALKTAGLRGAYHVLDLVQSPFRFVFWKIEQLKARIQDHIAHRRTAQ
jgi:hypothetical protein